MGSAALSLPGLLSVILSVKVENLLVSSTEDFEEIDGATDSERSLLGLRFRSDMSVLRVSCELLREQFDGSLLIVLVQ